MKQKWLQMLILAGVLILCSACSKKEPVPAPTVPPVTTAATEKTQQKSAEFYYGTWRITKGTDGKQMMFIDDMINQGLPEDFRDYRLILQSSGKYAAGTAFGTWQVSENGILCGNDELPFENGCLLLQLPQQNIIFIFEKVSTSQEFPSVDSTAPAKAPETAAPSGLRPEFKEAMDSYEAFFDEYCEFMAQYKENPTNLNLLTRYAGMLTKMQEMYDSMQAWDESQMTNEELKYYLEVTARIEQKMLNLL